MNRLLSSLLLGLAASSALAQPRPYFYLSAKPPSGQLPNTQEASVMVVRFVDYNGAWHPPASQVAQEVAAQAQALIPNLTDPNHLAVLLANFGLASKVQESPQIWEYNTSFLDPLDAISPPPDFANEPVATSPLRYMQPWMNQGRAKMRTWMQDFLNAYSGPVPARFHFDTELVLIGASDVNDTRVLEAVSRDPRWDSELVPGFGQTMKDLYKSAITTYGWNGGAYAPLDTLLHRTLVPQDPANRAYFIWYAEICQRAVDAVMKEAAYDVIAAHFADTPEASRPRMSNWSDFNSDGAEDKFGWYDGTDYHTPGTPHFTRDGVRGQVHFAPSGNVNYWGDLHPLGGPWSLWNTLPAHASGHYSAPVLYTVHPAFLKFQGYGDDLVNPYLPPSPPGRPDSRKFIASPARDLHEASLITHRRTIESILNSIPATPPEAIAPWVQGIGQWNTANYPENYEPPEDSPARVNQWEMVSRLAMLRAKRIGEILVFYWGNADIPINGWDPLRKVIDQVFQPHLTGYKALIGSVPPFSDPGPVDPLDVLRDTLRGPYPVLTMNSAYVSSQNQYQVVLQADFDNLVIDRLLPPAVPLDGLSLNIECSVSTPNVLGTIYVREPSDWVLVNPRFDQNRPDSWAAYDVEPPPQCVNCQFGFFANPDSDGTYETRRSFGPFPPGDWQTSGRITLKIVLSRAAPFTAKFDLVQLVGTGFETQHNSSGDTVLQGADFDHSQQVNSSDVAAYFGAYAEQWPAADLNNDGVIDVNDLMIFMARYNQ